MSTVVIMRGLPGSGKSTRAHQHAASASEGGKSAAICSADDYFIRSGRYKFDHRKLGEAHAWCMGQFVAALQSRTDIVIVDNTNITLWEYSNYRSIAALAHYTVQVEEMVCDSEIMAVDFSRRCLHGVPVPASLGMMRRWEHDDDAVRIEQDSAPPLAAPEPGQAVDSVSSPQGKQQGRFLVTTIPDGAVADVTDGAAKQEASASWESLLMMSPADNPDDGAAAATERSPRLLSAAAG